MFSPPILSIIIPILNGEAYLNTLIPTLFAQSFKNWELIFVDGLSSDQSLFIIKKYAKEDHRIKYATCETKGVYPAMNKGIKIATGEWIYFMGADDLLFQESTLETISTHIKSNPSKKIIYGDVISDIFEGRYGGAFNMDRLSRQNICHQSIFYHSSIFKDLKYNSKYEILADYALNLKLFSLYKNEWLWVDEIIAFFGSNGISSRTPDYKFQKDKFKLVQTTAPWSKHKILFTGFRMSLSQIKYGHFSLGFHTFIEVQIYLLKCWFQ